MLGYTARGPGSAADSGGRQRLPVIPEYGELSPPGSVWQQPRPRWARKQSMQRLGRHRVEVVALWRRLDLQCADVVALEILIALRVLSAVQSGQGHRKGRENGRCVRRRREYWENSVARYTSQHGAMPLIRRGLCVGLRRAIALPNWNTMANGLHGIYLQRRLKTGAYGLVFSSVSQYLPRDGNGSWCGLCSCQVCSRRTGRKAPTPGVRPGQPAQSRW